MCATEHRAASLDTVANDFAATTVAFRCHDMDRAFEAVEDMRLAVVSYLKRLVVSNFVDFRQCSQIWPITADVEGLK